MNPQAPRAVVMVRPARFSVNAQTAADNHFQRAAADTQTLAAQAHEEVTRAAHTLERHGVRVLLFDDDGSRDTPDSVFPNNWFSTHAGGQVVLYPMCAPNRRRERREDVLQTLRREYRLQTVIDLSPLEDEGVYLEGTGALVIDHLERVAYMARSRRADREALARLCAWLGYEPLPFDTLDARGNAIYHTNVMLAIGTHHALIGSDLIDGQEARAVVLARLQASGREVIELKAAQIEAFAGNALELQGEQGLLWAMSSTALNALTPAQRQALQQHAQIVALDVPAIERAGGSVRCMLAGVHLSPR